MLRHSIQITHVTKGKIKIQHASGRVTAEHKFHDAWECQTTLPILLGTQQMQLKKTHILVIIFPPLALFHLREK